MLPLLGPSTVRDTAGLPLEYQLDLILRNTSNVTRYSAYSLFFISRRADLLSASNVLDSGSVDPYLQIREAYRQKRWYDIHDGNPPDADFSDEELFGD